MTIAIYCVVLDLLWVSNSGYCAPTFPLFLRLRCQATAKFNMISCHFMEYTFFTPFLSLSNSKRCKYRHNTFFTPPLHLLRCKIQFYTYFTPILLRVYSRDIASCERRNATYGRTDDRKQNALRWRRHHEEFQFSDFVKQK